MTMVIENQGRQYGNMGYPESIYSSHLHSSPQFNDPWGSSSTSHAPSYATSVPKPEVSRSVPLSYTQLPTSAPSIVSGSNFSSGGYGSSDMQNLPQQISRSTYSTEPTYQSTSHTSAPYNTSNYSSMNYAQSLHQQQHQQHEVRKLSDTSETSSRSEPPTFPELDASRGMLALSHQNIADLTPRNIYEARNTQNSDGYGFPSSSHSLSSSISGPSHRDSYPYYSASVASTDSATDYSSAASDAGYESLAASRTLPRPTQLIGANLGPPAPQSMMGQFSSKMSSNTQKKHKCKVCDKRFTRPSSLQTHMYSHTGEKPFACTVEGCGRHFSVVSNLRRHKKVHKGEATSSGHSDDED